MQSFVRTNQMQIAQPSAKATMTPNRVIAQGRSQSMNPFVPANSDGLDVLREDIYFEDMHRSDPMSIGTIVDDRPIYFLLKRGMDFTVTALSMAFLLPMLIVLAVLVKRSSPGPAIFAQERVGARRVRRNGRVYWQRTTFTFYKFRSMYQDADQNLHRQFVEAYMNGDHEKMAAIQPDKDGADMFKLNGDPRVTGIGNFLRKTSLDELPQLWNVFRGDMSLVGPRPIVEDEIARYGDFISYYENSRPGMTGLWQVSGRNNVDYKERVSLDVWYARNWSLWNDVVILMKTVPVVFLRKGGY
jgi:lipopolysaccharide/colanic/teichoic acid biosynthesis glycosyltransferase